MSLKLKCKSLSKSVDHPYSQFRKIYILIFPWFNFKWSMTLYLAIRYSNKINKWTYIYIYIYIYIQVYYTHRIRPTCFGLLCGHLQGSAIRRIYVYSYFEILQNFWSDEQIYNLIFKNNTWIIIQLWMICALVQKICVVVRSVFSLQCTFLKMATRVAETCRGISCT